MPSDAVSLHPPVIPNWMIKLLTAWSRYKRGRQGSGPQAWGLGQEEGEGAEDVVGGEEAREKEVAMEQDGP